MEATFEKSAFSKCALAGLFSGYIATCVGLLYNFVYRGITHYSPSLIINVPSIIFGTLICCVFAGMIFYFLSTYVKGGTYIYMLLFAILCILLAIVALRSNYGGDLPTFQGFKGLLLGIDIIIGIFSVIFIPYFFVHNKIFMDDTF